MEIKYHDEPIVVPTTVSREELQKQIEELEIKNYGHIRVPQKKIKKLYSAKKKRLHKNVNLWVVRHYAWLPIFLLLCYTTLSER